MLLPNKKFKSKEWNKKYFICIILMNNENKKPPGFVISTEVISSIKLNLNDFVKDEEWKISWNNTKIINKIKIENTK